MRHKIIQLSNFTRAIYRKSPCFRPENEQQLAIIARQLTKQKSLARGNGLSYSDCCLNKDKPVIDCSRLRHFISFDEKTGLLVCQPGITFAELFTVHPDFIPPVIPGTVKATVGGGIANDVHGKNNCHAGTLGHHIVWLELQIGTKTIHCSPNENTELFTATIGGLGLTGVIKRVAIKLKKTSQTVHVKKHKLSTWKQLIQKMLCDHQLFEYQVAWLDLLHDTQYCVLAQANHDNTNKAIKTPKSLTIPKLPFRLINKFIMKQFNLLYFYTTKTKPQMLPLEQFNNPLDKINHWNRLYGSQGLVQFQAVFANNYAEDTLNKLLSIIKANKATPTLAVLKYFVKPGKGMLSFVNHGFTLAIDFIHNKHAVNAIKQMNETITTIGGKVYLAKDLYLTPQQFKQQYQNHDIFNETLNKYKCSFTSDLSLRLQLGGPK